LFWLPIWLWCWLWCSQVWRDGSGDCWVQELPSSSGTWLNGRRLPAGEQVRLKPQVNIKPHHSTLTGNWHDKQCQPAAQHSTALQQAAGAQLAFAEGLLLLCC
jgi:hypothetical protein